MSDDDAQDYKAQDEDAQDDDENDGDLADSVDNAPLESVEDGSIEQGGTAGRELVPAQPATNIDAQGIYPSTACIFVAK